MITDKTKLLQDIEAMKAKLASMEEELNKPDEFKHFPSKGDEYYYYSSMGYLHRNIADTDDLRINIFKSKNEAYKAYKKEVALEKIKRRIIELQGDWKPDWSNDAERKVYICYRHTSYIFEPVGVYSSQSFKDIPYIESRDTANVIIKEMEDELKLIFDID